MSAYKYRTITSTITAQNQANRGPRFSAGCWSTLELLESYGRMILVDRKKWPSLSIPSRPHETLHGIGGADGSCIAVS